MSSGPRECGVCWQVYDPAVGDSVRQVPAGTPFEELPDDWRCPNCDAAKERFLPPSPADPPAEARPAEEAVGAAGDDDPRVARLAADYRTIAATSMKDMPLNNPRLEVEAVGFRTTVQGLFGGLVTPWSIIAVLFPDEAAGPRAPIKGHHRALPAGSFFFLPQRLATAGDVEYVSLFSPAPQFEDHAAAVATVKAAVDLMMTAPQPEPSEAEAPGPEEPAEPPSRRDVLRLFRHA